MSEFQISNAIIESANISIEEHGFLSSFLMLKFKGYHQGFGGYTLHLPDDWKHYKADSVVAGHWIMRVMQVAGVSKWSDLVGVSIRVKSLDGRIEGIGNIIDDNWFVPREDFKKICALEEKQ